MPSRPVLRLLADGDLLATATVVRRYVTSIGLDEDDGDDVVQETVSRLLDNRWRIDRRTANGYAIATARSIVAESRRARALSRRHAPRLVDPVAAPDPFETAALAEEWSTVSAALTTLPPRDRQLLLEHHVDELSVGELASRHGTSPGAVAAALARARGRLRLEYCLQANRRQLTQDRCRQVLTSIALGSLARQRALGAGRHLAACEVCGPLAAVLTSKDRGRAGIGLPLLVIAAWGWLRRSASAHPAVGTATATATVAGGTAVAVILTSAHQPAQLVRSAALQQPALAPATTVPPVSGHGLWVHDTDILPGLGRASELSRAGDPVRAVDIAVLAVDADEGFWVGGSAHRMWVQLETRGESPVTVRAGDTVSFSGTIVRSASNFARSAGVTAKEDVRLLNAEQVHIDVSLADLHLSAPPPSPRAKA